MAKFPRDEKPIQLVLFFIVLVFSLWFIWRAFSSNIPAPKPIAENLPVARKIIEKPPSSDTASKDSSEQSDRSPIISIDPGHQKQANLDLEPIGPGSSRMKEKARGGARGIVSKIPEYKITLQISMRLKALLEKAGIRVVMTRETDDVNVSNIERARIANEAKANLFVRIHADGSESPLINGISTLYPSRNQWTEAIHSESLRAAQLIQQELIRNTGRKDNGIVARNDLTGFNWSKVPVVLVEVGFLSNPEEDELLNDSEFQQRIAQGIFDGIKSYLAGTLPKR